MSVAAAAVVVARSTKGVRARALGGAEDAEPWAVNGQLQSMTPVATIVKILRLARSVPVHVHVPVLNIADAVAQLVGALEPWHVEAQAGMAPAVANAIPAAICAVVMHVWSKTPLPVGFVAEHSCVSMPVQKPRDPATGGLGHIEAVAAADPVQSAFANILCAQVPPESVMDTPIAEPLIRKQEAVPEVLFAAALIALTVTPIIVAEAITVVLIGVPVQPAALYTFFTRYCP